MLLSVLLIQGFLIGFAVAAPVGPVGVLCIRTTLSRGWISGLLVGLGAALADAVYGGVAVFGLTFVTAFLHQHSEILRLGGGVFLFYLAYRTVKQDCSAEIDQSALQPGSLLASLIGTFFLTLTNPATLVSFMAIFAGLGILTDVPDISALLMVVFVFLGSLAWWVFLSSGIWLAKEKMSVAFIRKVNIFSGLMIAVFGVLVLLSLIKGGLI